MPKGKLRHEFKSLMKAKQSATDDSEDFSKLWIVVRHMRSCCQSEASQLNRFTLRGGEKIKLGRVIFRVKELVNSATGSYFSQGQQVEPISSSEQQELSSPGLLSNTDDGLENNEEGSQNDTPTLDR